MPQHLQLDRTLPLTVRRFLWLVSGRRNVPVDETLAMVGLDGFQRRDMQALSGGENRRALLAAALLGEPELLVLDEATAGMDVAGQAEFYDLVRRVRERHGCGILMVSHDLHLVMAATDFVICLNGHICCHGRPEAVTRHPEYLALFGARHAPHLAVFQHDLAHHHEHHDAHLDEAPGQAGHGHG